MSIRALRNAFDLVAQNPQLRPSASISLLVLADCHNQETGRCDPSVKTIARRGAISERAVRDGLRQLAELKLITITYRQIKTGLGKRNMTSRYRFKGAAKFAGGVGQNLPTNQQYTTPSAFDDLANLLDVGREDA
ncbi:helix-turn-helix domain-containing protein [Paracoccus sp. (in: a-proteobacteria)]|uniref:helix-turn-helix domain-containing protein n=1 Tax=Paracoccus sp. TaxID=267 RepID=UPI0033405B37